MNGPDKEEEPFLSYPSYEREQRNREEAQHRERSQMEEEDRGREGRRRMTKLVGD